MFFFYSFSFLIILFNSSFVFVFSSLIPPSIPPSILPSISFLISFSIFFQFFFKIYFSASLALFFFSCNFFNFFCPNIYPMLPFNILFPKILLFFFILSVFCFSFFFLFFYLLLYHYHFIFFCSIPFIYFFVCNSTSFLIHLCA